MIPNTATFVYVGTMHFEFVHAAAVHSAHRVGGYDKIRLIATEQPAGDWWHACEDLVELSIVRPPEDVFGVPLQHPAHVADVIRLRDMLEHGGTYLDLDVLSVAAMGALRGNDCVFSEQRLDSGGQWGLGCAVMMAAPESPFVREWYDGYNPATSHWYGFRSTGKDAYWSELSTRYPAMLSMLYPGRATILPHTAFYPYNWEAGGVRQLFVENIDVPADTRAIHLWESVVWKDHLAELGPAAIRRGGTTFLNACSAALTGSALLPEA
jgi:hypothetical protein